MRFLNLVRLLPFALAILPCVAALSDPPDSEINAKTGHIEIVDAVSAVGGSDVRHVTNTGEGEPVVVVLTQNALDDLGPKLAIESDGDTWVAWWRDGVVDEVVVRRKAHATGQWDAERVVSDGAEDSRNPSIVVGDSGVWSAYEIQSAGATTIAVNAINEDPDPIPFRQLIASTSFSGDVDVLIHSSSGALWVTWVDSAEEVGWSEYDASTGAWGLPAYEPYVLDDVAAARARIQVLVTGG